MARTTPGEVESILLGDYDRYRRPSLTPFIDTASVQVDDLVTYAGNAGKETPSDARLKIIEMWLAAHNYCCSDQPYSSKSTGGSSGSFQGQTTMGLKGTKYGQNAILLDPTGYLLSLANEEGSQAVEFEWLGIPISQQTPYYRKR